MHVAEINVYPVKSLKGISLQSATVEKRGLEFDRRWVIVDAGGNFLTQREIPKMATIRVAFRGHGLKVWTEDASAIRIDPIDGERVATAVWDRAGDSIVYDVETNEWFSDVLGADVALRYMPDDATRAVKRVASNESDQTGFADAYPALLGNEASMADLNSRMERALPINRFRPNIVVSGVEPWAEDNWARIRVGDAIFRVVKPSDRCVVTTTDQNTGERGKEPLRTLATFRMSKDLFPDRYESWGLPANSVLFGENMIPDTPGATIRVGNAVEVIETRD